MLTEMLWLFGMAAAAITLAWVIWQILVFVVPNDECELANGKWDRCPLCPQKRTSFGAAAISALFQNWTSMA
jgi:hypothetical protein